MEGALEKEGSLVDEARVSDTYITPRPSAIGAGEGASMDGAELNLSLMYNNLRFKLNLQEFPWKEPPSPLKE